MNVNYVLNLSDQVFSDTKQLILFEHHFIKITYVHNPRDVDLLARYLNDEKIGYMML
jgi:hypothetical protein